MNSQNNGGISDSEIVQVNIRMPNGLKKACLKQAESNRQSLQQWMCKALECQLELEGSSNNSELKETIETIKRIAESGVIKPLEKLTNLIQNDGIELTIYDYNCPNCHANVKETDVVCPNCGTPLHKKIRV